MIRFSSQEVMLFSARVAYRTGGLVGKRDTESEAKKI